MSEPHIVYRRASREDLPEVLILLERGQLDISDLRAEDILVAESGKIVGVNRIKRYADGAVEIASAYVIPEFRGRGINRKLTEILRDECTGPVYLITNPKNAEYVGRMGFSPILDGALLPDSIKQKIAWCAEKYVSHVPGVFVWNGTQSGE